MNKLLLIVFLCLCPGGFLTVSAQEPIVPDTGKIEIVQDFAIQKLIADHREINAAGHINGYRIKIHFGTDKSKAREIKGKFLTAFPKIPAYEKYDQPNFNIRVGDFRTKLDAYRALKEIQAEFPGAFIVVDEIEFPELSIPEVKP